MPGEASGFSVPTPHGPCCEQPHWDSKCGYSSTGGYLCLVLSCWKAMAMAAVFKEAQRMGLQEVGAKLGGSAGWGQSSSEEALLPFSEGNQHSDPLPLGTCLRDTVRAWSPKY